MSDPTSPLQVPLAASSQFALRVRDDAHPICRTDALNLEFLFAFECKATLNRKMLDLAAPASAPDLDSMVVRYSALRPCTTAFIDARTPGSDRKENFTIIGPGVAENPDQFVHISRPHGFNIGGARQPPRCVNSQHFHETAEVFFVHTSRWAFRTGEHADEGEVILNPGDVISIPTHVFRGFENVGDDLGFLYAVLGGDDPGRVIWAPAVLERAEGNGLALTEAGRLIDFFKGDQLKPGERLIAPMQRDALQRAVRHANSNELEAFVVRSDTGAAVAIAEGVSEAMLIGIAAPGAPPPQLAWAHGFTAHRLSFRAGAALGAYSRSEEEVWFIHAGRLRAQLAGVDIELNSGDVLTSPPGATRALAAVGQSPVTALVVRRGDSPVKPIRST